MLCYAMLCYVMLCYVMLTIINWVRVKSSIGRWDEIKWSEVPALPFAPAIDKVFILLQSPYSANSAT